MRGSNAMMAACVATAIASQVIASRAVAQDGTLAIRVGTLIDGSGGAPIKGAVVLDLAALGRQDVEPDDPVQLELEGVRLKTGLKLLLDQVGLTFRVVAEDTWRRHVERHALVGGVAVGVRHRGVIDRGDGRRVGRKAQRSAAKIGSPTPLMSATLPIYAAAMSTGHALHDTASVCAVLEAMAGVKRKRKK